MMFVGLGQYLSACSKDLQEKTEANFYFQFVMRRGPAVSQNSYWRTANPDAKRPCFFKGGCQEYCLKTLVKKES